MKNYIYPACFYKEDNGQYSVIFPDFDNATFGNDLNDALTQAEDFLRAIIIMAIRAKEKLPEPSDITKLKADEYPDGFVSLVQADLDKAKDKSVKKTLTIPAWLDEAALEQNINFSKVLQEALKKQLDL